MLIDPNVDLAKEEVSLLPKPWIVPLTTALESKIFFKEDQVIDDQ